MQRKTVGAPKKFNSEVFTKIVDDCGKYADKHPGFIKGKGMKASDVYKYYLLCKDEKGYPEISYQTLYKRDDFKEYLEKINRYRSQGLKSGIVVKKEVDYSEFDWMDYFENHKNQKDCGMQYLGQMINDYRATIYSLRGENEALKQKLKTSEDNKEKFRKETSEVEKKLKKTKETRLDYRQKYIELKEKYDSIMTFLDSSSEKLSIIKYNTENNIPTVIDKFTLEHSYLGENDKDTPSLNQLAKRFGMGEVLNEKGEIDEDALERELLEEDI